MTWDDYYERFYDLSLSTQKGYAYKLTSYGDAEEVFEVLSEFAFYDKQFATRFASKAVDGGVHFLQTMCWRWLYLLTSLF